jgi:hypothetical protein
MHIKKLSNQYDCMKLIPKFLKQCHIKKGKQNFKLEQLLEIN